MSALIVFYTRATFLLSSMFNSTQQLDKQSIKSHKCLLVILSLQGVVAFTRSLLGVAKYIVSLMISWLYLSGIRVHIDVHRCVLVAWLNIAYSLMPLHGVTKNTSTKMLEISLLGVVSQPEDFWHFDQCSGSINVDGVPLSN